MGRWHEGCSGGDDSVDRLVDFYQVALPATIAYRWEEAKTETIPKQAPWLFPPVSDEEELAQFEVLHRRWAKPIFDKCMLKLGGFYSRVGRRSQATWAASTPRFIRTCSSRF